MLFPFFVSIYSYHLATEPARRVGNGSRTVITMMRCRPASTPRSVPRLPRPAKSSEGCPDRGSAAACRRQRQGTALGDDLTANLMRELGLPGASHADDGGGLAWEPDSPANAARRMRRQGSVQGLSKPFAEYLREPGSGRSHGILLMRRRIWHEFLLLGGRIRDKILLFRRRVGRSRLQVGSGGHHRAVPVGTASAVNRGTTYGPSGITATAGSPEASTERVTASSTESTTFTPVSPRSPAGRPRE